MSNIGQEYVTRVHWLVRAVIGCAVMALVLGTIINWIIHDRSPWKIDLGIFIGLLVMEILFRALQNRRSDESKRR